MADIIATEIQLKHLKDEAKFAPLRQHFLIAMKQAMLACVWIVLQQSIDEEGCGAFFAAYREKFLWPE